MGLGGDGEERGRRRMVHWHREKVIGWREKRRRGRMKKEGKCKVDILLSGKIVRKKLKMVGMNNKKP